MDAYKYLGWAVSVSGVSVANPDRGVAQKEKAPILFPVKSGSRKGPTIAAPFWTALMINTNLSEVIHLSVRILDDKHLDIPHGPNAATLVVRVQWELAET